MNFFLLKLFLYFQHRGQLSNFDLNLNRDPNLDLAFNRPEFRANRYSSIQDILNDNSNERKVKSKLTKQRKETLVDDSTDGKQEEEPSAS